MNKKGGPDAELLEDNDEADDTQENNCLTPMIGEKDFYTDIRYITKITSLGKTSDHIDRLFEGDIPGQIAGSCCDDLKSIKNGLDRYIKTLGDIAGEIDKLKKAIKGEVVVGSQSANMHQESFKEMAQDVNDLTESVVIPLNKLMAVLGRKALK